MNQAEVYYKIFRKHYSKCSSQLEADLNQYISNFSYIAANKVNLRDQMYHTIIGLLESKTKLLSSRIADTMMRYVYDLVHNSSHQYIKNNNLQLKPNMSLVYEACAEKINVFSRRICLAIQSEMETIILTAERPYEKILEIFPPDQNQGKYHSRLKTMCYMNLLLALNYLFDLTNRTNGLNSRVVNLSQFKYPYEDDLTSSKGEFKFKRYKEMRNIVWEKKGQYYIGEIPPSHFGSKEIILPA